MKPEELLLSKDELPIFRQGSETTFFMPIYPALLRKDIKIKTSAGNLFQKAVEETEKELGHSPKLFYQAAYWDEDKLARSLFLNEHVGLYVQVNGRYFIPPYHPPESNQVKFSEEKLNAYSVAEAGVEYFVDDLYGPPFGFQTTNSSNIVYATLLRNWGVTYLNEALKEYMEKNKI